MKNITSTLIIVIFAMSQAFVNSQYLPAQFHISDDGLRLIRGNSESTGFYNTHTIDTIYLHFEQSDYWTQLTNNYESKTDIPATLQYKGEIYDSVGVRFKGMTSYMMIGNSEKKSFNISLDYAIDDQSIEGYKTLNLNNAAEDPSFLREFLYNYFGRKYIPNARTNFVQLYINDKNWGIYVNVQQLSKKHAKEWFIDADATRWRAEGDNGFSLPPMPPQKGGPGGPPPGGGFGAGESSLNYLGDDTTIYQNNYTLKNSYKSDPWSDLVIACDKLNNTPPESLIDSLDSVFDIDGALWFLATEILFTDDDSYVNKGGMDYYVYYDVGTNRIIPIEYDGNTTFQTRQVSSWSPFYNEVDTNFALMNVLFAVPELRQRYLAHVRTIMDECFVSSQADILIDYYADLISTFVYNDPKKLFTYNEFTADVDGLKTFIGSRKSYIMSNSEVNVEGLNISSVIFKANEADYSIPFDSQNVNVTAKVSGSAGVEKVNLYYGAGLMGSFNKTEMLDDGLHSDGSTDDGTYGATIPGSGKGTYVRFYIEAVAANAANTRSYSPAGAEHDIYAYKVKVAESIEGDVVINELMAVNSTTISDQDDEFDDWVELYNNSSDPVDLSGYYLTDRDDDLKQWQFPAGTVINGTDYLIIWADKDDDQAGLHAGFKLSSDGEQLLLVTPDDKITDEVLFNAQYAELSFSRIPNGSGSFAWIGATFNSENLITSTDNIYISLADLFVYPNPANMDVTVSTGIDQEYKLRVYTIFGSLVYQNTITNSLKLNLSNWDDGVYIIEVENCKTQRLIVVH